jgi:integrase
LALKKKQFSNNEISIFDEAIIYKRGDYWQFRMYLKGEDKYARKSLRTRSESTAIEKGKDAYHEISYNQKQGKTYFSITTKEGVENYIKYRKKDVEAGLIVSGRLATISTHLKHWLAFIGKDTKLKELESTDCENYYHYRIKTPNSNASLSTVKNEQSTINACIKWLFKTGETHLNSFEFKKLPKVDSNNEDTRRATLTSDEYERLCRVMRSYVAKSQKNIDANEILIRQIIRHYILIAANSGLRVGEQRQLRWSNVTKELDKDKDGIPHLYAVINVPAHISKVRKSRIFWCRGGHYFDRLKDLVKPKNDDALIFSVDGEQKISKSLLYRHFKTLMKLAKIEKYESRNIVPYSLRHFMITQRAISNVTFREIADMCGTSIAQISKTYYHVDDDMRRNNARADYRRMKDGSIKVL